MKTLTKSEIRSEASRIAKFIKIQDGCNRNHIREHFSLAKSREVFTLMCGSNRSKEVPAEVIEVLRKRKGFVKLHVGKEAEVIVFK